MTQQDMLNNAYQSAADIMQKVFIIELYGMYVNGETEGEPRSVLDKMSLQQKTADVINDAIKDEYEGEDGKQFRDYVQNLIAEVYNSFIERAQWKKYIETLDEQVLDLLGGVQGES